MKLEWSNVSSSGLGFDPRLWSLVESGVDRLSREELVVLVARDPGILRFTDEASWSLGPEREGHPPDVFDNFTSRVWIVYRHNNGGIYIARSLEDYSGIEFNTQSVYSPSGSFSPDIAFDRDGFYVIASQLQPVGDPPPNPEVWLQTHPYEGAGTRRVGIGTGAVVLPYKGGMRVYFRGMDGVVVGLTSSDGFSEETPQGVVGTPLSAYNLVLSRPRPNMVLTTPVVLYVGPGPLNQDDHLRYLRGPLLWQVGLRDDTTASARVTGVSWVDHGFHVKFYVYDEVNGSPELGAVVTFLGITRITGGDGIADFGIIGIPVGAHTFSVVLPNGTSLGGWALEITEDTTIDVPFFGALRRMERVSVGASVGGIVWEDTRVPVTFTVERGGLPLEGAYVEFEGHAGYTDGHGISLFPLVVAGSYKYTVTTPDGVVMVGDFVVDGPTNVLVVVVTDPELLESLSGSAVVEAITWTDTRGTVNFTVTASGEPVDGATVVIVRTFDSQTHTGQTDGNGEVSFFVGASAYSIAISHADYAPYRGLINLPAQAVLSVPVYLQDAWPDVGESISASASVDAVLWVEV